MSAEDVFMIGDTACELTYRPPETAIDVESVNVSKSCHYAYSTSINSVQIRLLAHLKGGFCECSSPCRG